MIIGLDMGGTHIDAVLTHRGEIIDVTKRTADRSNLFGSIWETIEELLKDKNPSTIEKINLSTTISTNAIVEGKTSPVGMVIESGPGLDPSPFACGEDNIFLNGYIDHRGREIAGFNETEVKKALARFKEKGITTAAAVTKFSPRNPSHELRIRDILKQNGFHPVTMGHTLSGKLNFPRRIFTAYLNCAIYNSFANFAVAIKKACIKKELNAPLHILKADGGTLPLDQSVTFPVQTTLSGPAASIMGCLALTSIDCDAILLDIGGTTTDISFMADGVPLFEPRGIKIGRYPTLVRSLLSVSIGLGGDSTIKVKNNDLIIGPERSGLPMALGGPLPTPTDAMVTLRLANFGNRRRALKAMEIVGQKLGTDPENAAKRVYNKFGDIIKNKAEEILAKINSQPVYTIRQLLHGKKLKPQKIIIIGGPAKSTVPILEKKFNLPCYVPENYHVANAIGAALSRNTFEITLMVDTERGILSIPEIGIYRKIGKDYDLETAKEHAIRLLEDRFASLGTCPAEAEVEITEESCFNMVRGFYTTGKNIRVRAQIKPGLVCKIKR